MSRPRSKPTGPPRKERGERLDDTRPIAPQTSSGSAPEAGARVAGRYLLLKQLGTAGSRRVFVARDEVLGREVALKLIPEEDAEAWQEARSAARVAHEGLPRVFDVGEIPGWHFLVMELVEGETPLKRLERDGPFSTATGPSQAYKTSMEATRRVAVQRPFALPLSAKLRLPARWQWPAVWAAGALVVVSVTVWAALPWIAPAPFCPRGTAPSLDGELTALRNRLGDVMGAPQECSHPNPQNGDQLQATSRGLVFARGPNRVPHFTTGHEHWALTDRGLLYWTGDSVDPPRSAVVVPPGSRGARP